MPKQLSSNLKKRTSTQTFMILKTIKFKLVITNACNEKISKDFFHKRKICKVYRLKSNNQIMIDR